MKYCPKCKRELILVHFGHNKATKDGYDYLCLECRKEQRDKKIKVKTVKDNEVIENLKGLRELAKERVEEKKLYPLEFSYNTTKTIDFQKYINEKKELQNGGKLETFY